MYKKSCKSRYIYKEGVNIESNKVNGIAGLLSAHPGHTSTIRFGSSRHSITNANYIFSQKQTHLNLFAPFYMTTEYLKKNYLFE